MIEKSVYQTVKVKDNVRVTVHENGRIRHYYTHNTWQTTGLNMLRDWLVGLGGTPITYIAWLDTSSVERARDIVTQRQVVGDRTVMLRQYLPSASTANGYTLKTIRGYNAQYGGTLFAEATFDAVGIAKTLNNQITVEWIHEFADGGA